MHTYVCVSRVNKCFSENFVKPYDCLKLTISYGFYTQKQPPDVFYQKRTFEKFTGKHLCQSLFFNKVAGLRPLLKKRLWHRCFPVSFTKFLGTPFLQNNSGRLLLYTCTKTAVSCDVLNTIIIASKTSLMISIEY